MKGTVQDNLVAGLFIGMAILGFVVGVALYLAP